MTGRRAKAAPAARRGEGEPSSDKPGARRRSARRSARLLAALGEPDLRAKVRAERARRHLAEFVRQAWPVVEPPSRPYQPGWHIEAICEHLEAVGRGEIRRLLINIPPRHMKSLAVAVFWPAWTWIDRPEVRWLFASYAQQLSTRDSVRCRRLIESPWYRGNWGASFELAKDQNQKTRFENDHTGYRLATSVGGAATGEGGDLVVVDDPHNMKEALSKVQREAALVWWDEAISTRLNDPERGGLVIVMQRLHERDLAGHVLEEGGWEHLCLPAEFEPERKALTSIGFTDPRAEDGELLWPERFGPRVLAEWKRRLGSYGAASQLQQRPAPRKGGMVKLEWFKRYRSPPANPTRTIQSWDTANKPGELNDYSVCGTWVEDERGYFLVDVLKRRLAHPDLLRTVKSHADRWRPAALLVEDKASGTSLIQHLRSETRYPVIAVQPRGDKVMRMEVASPTIEAGLVHLPERAPWLADYETELSAFPNSEHKDQADMTSQFLTWVGGRAAEPRIRSL